MLRDLKSRVTGRIQFAIDEETYQKLIANGNIKKYIVIQEHSANKPIPDELIVKKIVAKPAKVKNIEDKTLNDEK
jgi:hypothetical protein